MATRRNAICAFYFLLIEIDNGGEVGSFQACPADETAVDLGLGHEPLAVLGVHRAAVLDAHPADVLARIHLFHALADIADRLVGLFVRRGLARADRPDGFV